MSLKQDNVCKPGFLIIIFTSEWKLGFFSGQEVQYRLGKWRVCFGITSAHYLFYPQQAPESEDLLSSATFVLLPGALLTIQPWPCSFLFQSTGPCSQLSSLLPSSRFVLAKVFSTLTISSCFILASAWMSPPQQSNHSLWCEGMLLCLKSNTCW